MSIFDLFRRLEPEQAAYEPIAEETWCAGGRVPEGEILTEGEGEGQTLPTLRKGDRGETVVLLQETLNAAGYDCGSADGIFGKRTKEAVKAFQQAHGLKVDGVTGPQTWTALGLMDAPSRSVNVQPPDFKQYDSRWASKMYSNHNDKSQTMKSSGCGPTAMADIVAAWWDRDITPYALAQMSMEWGTRTYDSGTSSTFFRKCHERYGGSYQTTKSLSEARKCLTEGGLVIVCFGTGTSGKPGYKKWTKGGHYCCIWQWDGEYYRINDPASASSSRAKGTEAEILNARKGFYLFWR